MRAAVGVAVAGVVGAGCGGTSDILKVVHIATAASTETMPLPASCLRADAVNVYWSIGDAAGAISRAPIAGGPAVTLAPDRSPCVESIDAQNVYWVNSSEYAMGVGIAGGVPAQWGPGATSSVASNGSLVVTEAFATGTGSSLWVTPMPGTGAQPWEIDPVPAVYSVGMVQVDDTHAYFRAVPATGGAYAIMRVPLDGTTSPAVETLYTLAPSEQVIGYARDADNLYVATTSTSSGLGAIVQVPRGGGPPVAIIENEYGITSIAVDAAEIYWTAVIPQHTSPVLRAAPIGGGEVRVLGLDVTAIATGPTAVVWSTPGVVDVLATPWRH